MLELGDADFDVETTSLPKLEEIPHYGDSRLAEFRASTIGKEMQELYLISTFHNRYINEAMRMSGTLFPVMEQQKEQIKENYKFIQSAKETVLANAAHLKSDGKSLEASTMKAMMACLEKMHCMQVQSFQQLTTTNENTSRMLEVMSRMLTSIRNIVVKMPGVIREEEWEEERGEGRKSRPLKKERGKEVKREGSEKGKDRDKKEEADFPKYLENCSEEQKNQVESFAVSLGRDSDHQPDPFDTANKCNTKIFLPPMSDKELKLLPTELKGVFQQSVEIFSMDQALQLLEARYFHDETMWETLLEWPKVAPEVEPLDLWRVEATDKSPGGKGKEMWMVDRENHLRTLCSQWLETNELTQAVFQLIYLLENRVEDQDMKWMEQVPFIYTGIPSDFWGVGFLKWRIAHKIREVWPIKSNSL